MIKAETQIGKIKITIEANSVNDIFNTIKDIRDEYQKRGLDDYLLTTKTKTFTADAILKKTIKSGLLANISQSREPKEFIEDLNKLISVDADGDIIPLFPQGTFRAKELILTFLYTNYVQGKSSQLKEISEFLTKEGISQGAKDVMMSNLRKSRLISQKEGIIGILNLPFVRKTIKEMATIKK